MLQQTSHRVKGATRPAHRNVRQRLAPWRDRDRVVRVDGKYDVLLGPHRTRDNKAELAFKLNRDMIERLASAKYSSDDYVGCANGTVVPILSEDLDPLMRATLHVF